MDGLGGGTGPAPVPAGNPAALREPRLRDLRFAGQLALWSLRQGLRLIMGETAARGRLLDALTVSEVPRALLPVETFLRVVAAGAGRPVEMRNPCAATLGRDEALMLRALAACQAGDAALARGLLETVLETIGGAGRGGGPLPMGGYLQPGWPSAGGYIMRAAVRPRPSLRAEPAQPRGSLASALRPAQPAWRAMSCSPRGGAGIACTARFNRCSRPSPRPRRSISCTVAAR